MVNRIPAPEVYIHAAWLLDVDSNALRALAEVEAGPYGAFNDDGTPVILFERHVFERLTHGKYNGAQVPNGAPEWAVVSSPVAGGYGPVSVQHKRLAVAAALDRDAALQSASWGLFQIMGENFRSAGFNSIQAFVNAMYADVDNHVRALVFFIHSHPQMHGALRNRDWSELARHYNGPQYMKNHWDVKMAEAYLANHA